MWQASLSFGMELCGGLLTRLSEQGGKGSGSWCKNNCVRHNQSSAFCRTCSCGASQSGHSISLNRPPTRRDGGTFDAHMMLLRWTEARSRMNLLHGVPVRYKDDGVECLPHSFSQGVKSVGHAGHLKIQAI